VASRAAARRIELAVGPVEYADIGTGPTLVFVHGVFAGGALWGKVVAALHRRFRCIVPRLPLGGHTLTGPRAGWRTPSSSCWSNSTCAT